MVGASIVIVVTGWGTGKGIFSENYGCESGKLTLFFSNINVFC
jgi:hypothetical protein